MLVYALRPQWVLEIGTFSGYSSLSMAAGLPRGGRITTCELSAVHAEAARAAHRPQPLRRPHRGRRGPRPRHGAEARRALRLRVHRRRQDELPRVLRSRPAQAGAGRADRRRQHAVERPGGRRQRPVRRHQGHPRLQRRRGGRPPRRVRAAARARRGHPHPPGGAPAPQAAGDRQSGARPRSDARLPPAPLAPRPT